ncbi:NUDIX domain-containing protein [Ulvibacterium sp.]|uniref:NUDIX hydrolase n=1 Tax=Ulvibacterium sp. TaxID=2665914 RepID=UPI002610CD2D|nr:NUDIX domain-containing protein [Ulvibacterium sp.]
MNRTYKQIQQITLAVDCIIFGFDTDQLEVLLVHRGFEPEKERWSLMGGFVRNEEDLDEAANRVLRNLSGLNNVYMEQVRTFGKANRDPYERVVSTTYSALILKKDYKAEFIKEYRAEWFPIHDLPDLIFDHKDMVVSALQRLQRRVRSVPIGFNLLPGKFTLPQLQKLYEGILGEKIDKRNFRKKLGTMDFLVRLDEKDRSQSKKGAFLYRFDKKKYNKAKSFSI